jgi:hypothetical protein
MIDQVIKKHPQVKIVATTLRDVRSTNHHNWSAVAWINGQTYQAPTAELDVFDRVGGGDGFASGFFYGLLTNEPPEECVKLGWAHGALLTTFPGDTTMATVGAGARLRQRRLGANPAVILWGRLAACGRVVLGLPTCLPTPRTFGLRLCCSVGQTIGFCDLPTSPFDYLPSPNRTVESVENLR